MLTVTNSGYFSGIWRHHSVVNSGKMYKMQKCKMWKWEMIILTLSICKTFSGICCPMHTHTQKIKNGHTHFTIFYSWNCNWMSKPDNFNQSEYCLWAVVSEQKVDSKCKSLPTFLIRFILFQLFRHRAGNYATPLGWYDKWQRYTFVVNCGCGGLGNKRRTLTHVHDAKKHEAGWALNGAEWTITSGAGNRE